MQKQNRLKAVDKNLILQISKQIIDDSCQRSGRMGKGAPNNEISPLIPYYSNLRLLPDAAVLKTLAAKTARDGSS